MGSSDDDLNIENGCKPDLKRCQANFVTSDHARGEIEKGVFSGEKTQPITINRLFCLPEPILSNDESDSDDTQSWNDDFVEVSEAHISTWDAFNDENVDIMFWDFLDEKLQPIHNSNLMVAYGGSHHKSGIDDTREVFAIEEECHLNIMMESASIARVLEMAFAFTAKEFQERVNASSASGTLDTGYEANRIRITRSSFVRKSSETIPDWLFCLVSESASRERWHDLRWALRWAYEQNAVTGPDDDEPDGPDPDGGPTLANILSQFAGDGIDVPVVGEVKRKAVFNPANLADPDKFPQVRSTLGQMLMYCRWAKTRYAFVLTSEEVTCLRFFRLEDSKEEEQFGVHYAVLPWKREPGKVSVWKGIWALVMLSLHNKHRPIVPEDQIHDLNSWSRVTDNDQDQGRWENHLSKIVVDDGYWAERARAMDASSHESAAQPDRHEEGKATGQRPKRSTSGSVERPCKVIKSK
ncbi:hypothetical protein PG997_010053 [Apiospora hydei]|uniref:Fungal-type protein kinase domain-containing protein n=1 Tax=Apiospora hydei TaxID=1337664 RepID=A0ABR1VVW6_9PEZI